MILKVTDGIYASKILIKFGTLLINKLDFYVY
jgi:hypothetical protein